MAIRFVIPCRELTPWPLDDRDGRGHQEEIPPPLNMYATPSLAVVY